MLFCILHLHCVPKNIPNVFDFNLKTNYQILMIFGRNIPDTICHQRTFQFPTSPNFCFCTTCGKHSQWNITFCQMQYDCLINITRKNILLTFLPLWLIFHPVVCFSTAYSKIAWVFSHYTNTGKETLSPFIDSSIDNVLLQTNPGCTSCFLTSQTLLNFIW